TVIVTMDPTIDHLTINPSNPTVNVGASTQLTFTAFNLQNEVVVTAPQNITWNSGTPANATITNAGNATGVAVGTSQITVHESESGKTSPPVTLTVTSQSSGCVPGPVLGSNGLAGSAWPRLNHDNSQSSHGIGTIVASNPAAQWTVTTGQGSSSVPAIGT